MIWSLDKIVIDCGSRGQCTTVPWQDPVTYVYHPWWQSSWAMIVGAILILAIIMATAVVRYRRHERLESEHGAEQETERVRVAVKHTSCPTCGTVYVPEK